MENITDKLKDLINTNNQDELLKEVNLYLDLKSNTKWYSVIESQYDYTEILKPSVKRAIIRKGFEIKSIYSVTPLEIAKQIIVKENRKKTEFVLIKKNKEVV